MLLEFRDEREQRENEERRVGQMGVHWNTFSKLIFFQSYSMYR